MPGQPAPALAPRLAAVAALVPHGSRVADVGCDHGLLALHLASSGRCAACIATEIDGAVLSRARRPPEDAAWAGRISWRAGFGLDPLSPDDRIDTIVLAGLGAGTMIGVLSTPRLGLLAVRRLVVQPQTDMASVRAWLVGHAWALVAEAVVRDRGRLYEIAAAERGGAPADLHHPGLSREDVLAVGPILLGSAAADVVALWESRRLRLERIAGSGARGAMADRAAGEAARARRILAALRDRTAKG